MKFISSAYKAPRLTDMHKINRSKSSRLPQDGLSGSCGYMSIDLVRITRVAQMNGDAGHAHLNVRELVGWVEMMH